MPHADGFDTGQDSLALPADAAEVNGTRPPEVVQEWQMDLRGGAGKVGVHAHKDLEMVKGEGRKGLGSSMDAGRKDVDSWAGTGHSRRRDTSVCCHKEETATSLLRSCKVQHGYMRCFAEAVKRSLI